MAVAALTVGWQTYPQWERCPKAPQELFPTGWLWPGTEGTAKPGSTGLGPPPAPFSFPPLRREGEPRHGGTPGALLGSLRPRTLK